MVKSEKETHASNFAGMRLCGAKARRNNHQPCKAPAMKNKNRCRLHGGKCTGPKTPEGKLKAARAPIKHGRYTAAARAERKRISALLKECNKDLKSMNDRLENGREPNEIFEASEEPSCKIQTVDVLV